MRKRHGHLDWWPGDTRFEIVAGAVLTQQSTWKNVEKAISNLKAADCMDLESMSLVARRELEQMIRPTGYFRQKAERLQSLCRFIKKNYGTLDKFLGMDTDELRKELLAQNGIGYETCDSIMLYAADKPVFVIDAYTKRILSRVYGISEQISYKDLQGIFEKELPGDTALYNDFHAQFVELGKRNCRKIDPSCSTCSIMLHCRYYATNRPQQKTKMPSK